VQALKVITIHDGIIAVHSMTCRLMPLMSDNAKSHGFICRLIKCFTTVLDLSSHGNIFPSPTLTWLHHPMGILSHCHIVT